MAKANFPCPKCERKFIMAAHLARHVNAMHGGRKAKVGGRRGPGRRKSGRSSGRQSYAPLALTGFMSGDTAFSANSSSHVLNVMNAYHDELASRRAAIDSEMAALSSALAVLGGAATPSAQTPRRGRPGRRAGRPGAIKNFILRVLESQRTPMGPREIAAAVIQAGYKSKSANVTKVISNTLPKIKAVKRVGFGKYTA